MRFLLIFWCAFAFAQDYPTKNVTIIVPYPAGGPTDQLARLLATRFSEKLGKPFIVENVTGGGTTIGTGRVARAAPDGHTLLLHNLQLAANVALYTNLQYDTVKEITAVSFINRNPLVLVGRKSLPPANLGDLIAYMRKTSTSMAHPGSGSSGHLSTALFAQAAKVVPVQVPYRGGAPMVQDLLGEQVDLLFGTPQQLLPLVSAGRIKAYGLTARETSPRFPGAASLVSALGPKLEVYYWHALFAPTGTPAPVLDKVAGVVQAMLADAALVKSWADTDVSLYPPEQRSPKGAQALFLSEVNRWGGVVRDNKIQPVE